MQISGTNFQSWTTFSLDIEGLTCVVGPSNLGKSAVFRSIVAITRNDLPEGWIREGTKKVELTLTDGLVEVNMYRSDKTSPVYTIGDAKYEKLNGKVPDEITALGLNPIKIGALTFDPTFASQFDPQFGLSWSPTELNSVLGAFSSTEKLEKGKKEVNQRITRANQEAKLLAEEVATMNGQLIRCKELAEISKGIQEEVLVHQRTQATLEAKAGKVVEIGGLLNEFAQVHEVLAQIPDLTTAYTAARMEVALRVYISQEATVSRFIPLARELAGIQRALDQIPSLDAPNVAQVRILDLIPVLLVPRLDISALPTLEGPDVDSLLDKAQSLQKVLTTKPTKSLDGFLLPGGPSSDKLEILEKLVILRKGAQEIGKAIQEAEDEIESLGLEITPLQKELRSLDEIECPNCHHRWKETK